MVLRRVCDVYSSSMQVCGGDAMEKVDALFRANATQRLGSRVLEVSPAKAFRDECEAQTGICRC